MKELAQKCRIFTLNDFLKGFSGSSSYLVLLRKTKIEHYEKYVVFTVCFSALDQNKAACGDQTV